MREVKLTIVVPVYNVERFVDVCLNSIVQQNCKECEVIIVDDGSTDNSLSLCQKYENEYDYIKVISQQNGGLSAARNTGIRSAKGRYILFLDSDDFLAADALSKILYYVEADKDIILGRAQKFDEITEQYYPFPISYKEIKMKEEPSSFFNELLRKPKFWFAAWLIVIKTEFLVENSLYFKESIFHEDELWVPQVFINAKNMSVLDFDFYCYRVGRSGSIVNVNNIKKSFDKITIIDELYGLKYIDKERMQIIKSRIASLLFGLIIHLNEFKTERQFDELCQQILKRRYVLKYKKYWLVYILSYLVDILSLSKILNGKI